MHFLLYARKSTDEEDRQVLSIEAQITELREFAQKEKLEITEEFIESKTAKVPGRPIFDKMMEKIELGGPYGILAWHPDRLARNSVDGGKIIYLVDTGQIAALKFPTFWFDATPQGKFMLTIAFGQSKYFIDNLSENIKRGFRQKLRRGEMPGRAPVGYLNELRHHTIVKDPERHEAVRMLFETYAKGECTLEQAQKLSLSWGLVSRFTGHALSMSKLQELLKNPFYYGMFIHKGEMYQGSHEPIISKRLFDAVQAVMSQRAKPRKAKALLPFAFRGLFTCGECGRAITAENKHKSSGLRYTYYRCTKKGVICSQRFVEERQLVLQINDLISSVALPHAWKEKFLERLERERKIETTAANESAQNLKIELRSLEEKLIKLLDAYLDQTITNEEYTAAKRNLLNRKVEITEQLGDFGRTGARWLEPFKQWILAAHQAHSVASENNLEAKRNFVQKIGSNFRVVGRKAAISLREPWSWAAQKDSFSVWSG